jgi:ribonuclease HI
MIYTDGSFWKEKKRGMHAFIATKSGAPIANNVGWVLAASSFNSEIAALLSALNWVNNNIDNIGTDEIYLLIDNKGVIQSFLSMAICSSQMMALHINLLLADLLTQRPQCRLLISHCPSHSGVRFNERIDQLTTSFVIRDSGPPIMLWQHFVNKGIQQADDNWHNQSLASSYRGRGWLQIRCNKKPFCPYTRNKASRNFFTMELVNNDMYHMARLTRALTGHAPIGGYYLSCPDHFPGFPTNCNFCCHPTPTPQTCCHILTVCCRYSSLFPSIRYWINAKNNDELLKKFLQDNNKFLF